MEAWREVTKKAEDLESLLSSNRHKEYIALLLVSLVFLVKKDKRSVLNAFLSY